MKKRIFSFILCLVLCLSLLPMAAQADSRLHITHVDLTIDVPEHGKKPSYTAAVGDDLNRYRVVPGNGGGYTNGIYWYDETANRMLDESAAFTGGHNYSVHIKLEKTGSPDFSDGVTGKINEAEATVEKYTDSIVVSREIFCLPLYLDAAAVTITAPEPGANPSFTAKAGGEHYSADSVAWYLVDNEKLNQIQKTLTEADRFEAGKTYVAAIELKPEDGYAFSGSVTEATVTVNGVQPTFVDAHTASVRVQHAFALPADSGALSAVALTVTAPEAGKNPAYSVALDPASLTVANRQMGASEYSENGVAWYDTETRAYLNPADTFTAGHAYQVSIGWIKTPAGEKLTADAYGAISAAATVNGGGAKISGSATSFIVTYTFPALAAPAETPEPAPEPTPEPETPEKPEPQPEPEKPDNPQPQPETPEKNLTSIYIAKGPEKTDYIAGAVFDPKGMEVLAGYSDGSAAAVTGFNVTPSGALSAGQQYVTVSYTEGGITKTAAQPVTVSAEAAKGGPFVDVAESDYYYVPVLWAYNHQPQITNGIDATHFGPAGAVTRGQAVTFLWRAAGCPEPGASASRFADVTATDYYYKPVLWAVEMGITNGTDDTHFSPALSLTQAHIVTFLYRAAGSPGAAPNPNNEWYTDAMDWGYSTGLFRNMGRTDTAPMDPCPRADVVCYLYRQMA